MYQAGKSRSPPLFGICEEKQEDKRKTILTPIPPSCQQKTFNSQQPDMDVEYSEPDKRSHNDMIRDKKRKKSQRKFAGPLNRKTKNLKKVEPSSSDNIPDNEPQSETECNLSTEGQTFDATENCALTAQYTSCSAREFERHGASSIDFTGTCAPRRKRNFPSSISVESTEQPAERNKNEQSQLVSTGPVHDQRTNSLQRSDYKELKKSVPSLSLVKRHSKPHIVREAARYIEELRLKVDQKYSTPKDRELATRYIRARLSQCRQQPNQCKECPELCGSSCSQTSSGSEDGESKS